MQSNSKRMLDTATLVEHIVYEGDPIDSSYAIQLAGYVRRFMGDDSPLNEHPDYDLGERMHNGPCGICDEEIEVAQESEDA